MMLPFLMTHLLSSAVPTAEAHHNKGLPHYGYFENYPQVPTEEYVRIDGRWEVGATIFNFQGIDARESSDTPNDVKFYMYMYDLELDEAYVGPMRVDIVREGQIISTLERIEPDGEGVYISRETLPESGDYDLVFTFPEGNAELPFAVDLAVDDINWGVLGGLGLGLLALFGLSMHGHDKRLKQHASAADAPVSDRPVPSDVHART